MVRTEINVYTENKDSPHKESVYGIIREIRYKSQIAFLDFLPLHKLENRWVTFSSMVPAYT